MPKAGDVAKELRRVAEALEREPETELKRPSLCFFCNTKEEFVASARLLPKPLTKRYEDDDRYPTCNKIHLEYTNDAIHIDSSVYRSAVCRVVRPAIPAQYDCDPILSPDEEAALVESK